MQLRALTTFHASDLRLTIAQGDELPDDHPVIEGRAHLFERVDEPGRPVAVRDRTPRRAAHRRKAV